VLLDECPLHHKDVQGHAWAPLNERATVSIKNENDKQTYFGCLDVVTGNIVIKAFDPANTEAVLELIKHVREVYAGKKIKLIWDGAS